MARTVLLELPEQLARAGRIHIGERLAPSSGEGGDTAQELSKLTRRAGVELAIGAASQPCELVKNRLDLVVVPFLKPKNRRAQLGRDVIKRARRHFLAGVTDKDGGINRLAR